MSSIFATISFSDLMKGYAKIQSQVMQQVKQLASRASVATPGKFMLLQFTMSNIVQIGESISNLISTVQSMIMNAIRNQKVS